MKDKLKGLIYLSIPVTALLYAMVIQYGLIDTIISIVSSLLMAFCLILGVKYLTK